MARTPDELKKMLERFEAVIRGAVVKLTPQRIAIYREVARTADHPDIAVGVGPQHFYYY